MATSGSTNFEPNVTEFVEEAYERCGLELRTGYDLKTAKRSINLMLAEWANRGLNQWTIDQATQTVTEGTTEYTLNANIIDILDVVVRRTINDTQTDISMSRIGRSEYLNIPNKETKSRPSQFFLDKSNIPVLKIWPAPENSTDVLVFNKIPPLLLLEPRNGKINTRQPVGWGSRSIIDASIRVGSRTRSCSGTYALAITKDFFASVIH